MIQFSFRLDHMRAMDMRCAMLQYARMAMKPLAGKRILVTRAHEQARSVCRQITRRGGIPVLLPCLAVECLPEHIRRGLVLLRNVRHVVFTSANGVRCVAGTLKEPLSAALAHTTVAAVGNKTAAALGEAGITDVMLPGIASQAGLLRAFLESGVPSSLILFRAEEGSDVLASGLREHGCSVHTIHAYRTICPGGDASDICRKLAEGRIDAVLLGSGKTARHYVQRIGNAALADRPAVAVISPQTASCARALGLDVQVVAKQASFSSMLDELGDYFQLHCNEQGDNP